MSEKKKLLLSSLASGLLFSFSWFEWSTGLIIFFAFVPLMWLEDYIDKNKMPTRKLFLWASLTFFTWNTLTTWWIFNASFAGMLTAFVVNTFLQTLTFWLFHLCKRNLGSRLGYIGLVFIWLAFEYSYLNAEISWTWLNLGNAFAKHIEIIQWYEYTGTLGGTLWVLVINILVFKVLMHIINLGSLKAKKIEILSVVLLVTLPILFSVIRYSNYQEKEDPYEIVCVQPNVDPYKKFVSYSHKEQTQMLIDIAQPYITKNTDYVVCPETAITGYTDIDYIDMNKYVRIIRHSLQPTPKLKYIVGMTLKKEYRADEERTATAQKYSNANMYFDTYNSSVQIDTSNKVQVYHKSQLVVGVEKMPYPRMLKFLNSIMLRLGGTFRSHATQKERENHIALNDSLKVAPVICWENVFGEYVTDYVKKGAGIIFVITNEGWWGNTHGYIQLNHLSQLRAIENRRSVVRSANTGVSSFINQRGDIQQSLGWWKQGALKQDVNANSKLTFYAQYGDYIGRIAAAFAILFFLLSLVQYLKNRKPTRA